MLRINDAPRCASPNAPRDDSAVLRSPSSADLVEVGKQVLNGVLRHGCLQAKVGARARTVAIERI